MRTTVILLAVLVTGSLAGCGTDDGVAPPVDEQPGDGELRNGQDGPDGEPENGQEQADASLDDTLRFASGGPDGEFRLSLEPDGAATGRINLGDPFEFEVADDDLATIAALLDGADLAALPPELIDLDADPGEMDGAAEEEFEYGDAQVRYVSGPMPDELNELSTLLRSLMLRAELES